MTPLRVTQGEPGYNSDMNEREAEQMTSQSDKDQELKKTQGIERHPEWASQRAGNDAEGTSSDPADDPDPAEGESGGSP